MRAFLTACAELGALATSGARLPPADGSGLMATIEHDWRDRPPRQPDDPGARDSFSEPKDWIILPEGAIQVRADTREEAGRLAHRICAALDACDEDGTPLAWPSRATMAMVFIGGLIAGAIGMAVLLTGVEWVR